MTVQQIYDLALSMGIKSDPRSEAEVKRLLGKVKKEYDELPEKKKKYYDKEKLNNPYTDTRIVVGEPKREIKRVLAGIDVEGAELLLADRLSEKGKKIDAVIAHHPIGTSFAALGDVMDLQVDAYAQDGLPVNVIDALIRERATDIKRKLHSENHFQVVDTARLLDMPLFSFHTVWDNMGDKFMTDYLAKRKFDTVGEVVEYLMELPEYQESSKLQMGPEIVSGGPNSRAGKVSTFFTGGTNPSKEVYMEMAKAGIGTIVDMHVPEDALKELKKLHVNVVNAGHIASDSIGANLFLDALEKKGVEVIPFSGLIRVKR
ncbi:NGG1p interacting factor NIF3 [Candidatus Dojkabacteria bacterium]|uniref:NGG1p interacting factor NIF3 n=1 Tax=Candidatus Dojkabacteria bacterium TaxID=2099670 RepID=A0A5C7J346_9BACT|nr:MAG: NGG1p interacting factor NIF3 [Candidatus Dojkabacteria bacterium]